MFGAIPPRVEYTLSKPGKPQPVPVKALPDWMKNQ